MTGLGLTGPSTVHLDQEAQFAAIATYSDGSTRDVTSEAVWNANPKYLGVVSPGKFLPKANGESHVNASFSGRHANVTGVVIVPAGTYRLTGTVREEGIPLRGVKVVIETEAGRLTTSVGDDGAYTAYGVAGRAGLFEYEHFCRSDHHRFAATR